MNLFGPRKDIRLDQENVFAWAKKMHSTGPRKGIRLDQEHAFAWTKKRYSLGSRKCIHLGQKMSFTYEPKLNQYMLYYNDGTVAVPITTDDVCWTPAQGEVYNIM